MAKQNESNETTVSPATRAEALAQTTLSTADLLTLLTTAIKQGQDGTQQQLLAVLSEMRNPQKSDGEKALEEQMRKSTRAMRAKQEANLKVEQDNCPHFQGCSDLSDKSGDMTSIVKHRLDDNRVIGICTNCLRLFEPGDADYGTQMRRKSGNQMSQAGQRFAFAR